ncbi:RNA-binding S4 domain-containing protein [Pseudocolwellia agarivorans]|uniref:RNA-binding S4 domain-containing protein n=1 Tax=Pseudocolwellia agarivorans TaxID=1911682 RepID=UPI000987BBC2|nr:RNA-binding S4 domain-containing protein [Pseudocolwellia agarivorans]
MSAHSIFDICVEPIELFKLLKISNMAESAGEAKTMISEGNVLVNKKVVDQKRKKVRRGDVIELNGKSIKLAFNPTKKPAEVISKIASANVSAKKKRIAKSKARVIASGTVAKPLDARKKAKVTEPKGL